MDATNAELCINDDPADSKLRTFGVEFWVSTKYRIVWAGKLNLKKCLFILQTDRHLTKRPLSNGVIQKRNLAKNF